MYRRTYDGWGYSPLSQITAANVGRLKPVWTLATGSGRRPPGAADRQQRGDVCRDTGQSGAGDRRQEGRPPVAFQAADPGRHAVAASDEPRRRAARGQGLFRRGRCGAGRARRQDRQGGLEGPGRGLHARILHVAGAAGRRRQGDGRRLGRRTRGSRLCRCVRRRDRQAAMENLHGAGPRRAGQRDLAQGRPMEDRRRLGVDHRRLRS